MPDHDVADLTDRELARVVKSGVTPRPIAWVSTRGPGGVDNLAPYSSYNYVTSAPAVLQFNASRRSDGALKHSARNAIDRGEFAVNVVTEALAEEMDHTSESVPADVSEFDRAGVERAPCRTVDAPRVADAAVTFECSLYDSLEVHGKVAVLGEVEHVHLDDGVLTDGEVDMRKIDTVGRLGGPYYTGVEMLGMERQY